MGECVDLGSLVNIRTGKLNANAADENGLYPFFTCSVESLTINTYAYDCECVLIAGNGDLNVKYYNGKFNAYQRTYIIESKDKQKLNVRYLYHFLSKYVDTLRNISIGGVIKYIKLGDLTDIKFPLLSIEEQQRIVEILDKADEIRTKKKLANDKLDEFLKSTFVDMFGTPYLNENNFQNVTFSDICTVRQGLQIPISERKNKPALNRYKYITIQYLNGKKETEYIENPKANVICNEQDILMTRTGNTGMVITNVSGVFHNNFFLIDFNRDILNKTFLVFYLRHPKVQIEIMKKAGTSTIPDLNHSDFYKIELFIPPIDLQNKFAELVQKVEAQKEKNERVIEQMDNLFNSLMQQAFSQNG